MQAKALQQPTRIADATFVVVDTETTGTRAGADSLIEIAAVRVRGGEAVDRFSALINPGRAVPRFITELTGISTAMLYGQPTIAEVLPRFLDFLGDAVFVAHNAPFDVGMINGALEQLGRPPLSNPVLCTLRLARRLLPGLPSKGLSGVADFYGIKIDNRHRALGDAEATAAALIRFLDRLAFDHGIEDVEALMTFQNRSYRALKQQPKALQRIREEVLPQLPDRPGVYFMKNGRGQILYIGKAKSLKNRVRSYFTGIEGHPTRIRQLVDAVREVEWEETGSELGALLLESRLIKIHQPRFNRALLRYRNRPFIRVDVRHPFPRVTWSSYLLNDGAEYFGPVAGRRQAELVVELINRFYLLRECDDDLFARGKRCFYADIGRCAAPCEGGEAAARYGDELARVRAFLTGRDRSLLDQLEKAMREAAGRMAYEEAGQYRDWMRRLSQMLDKQQRVAAPVLAHNAVLYLPGVVDGTVQLYLVRFGRLVETVTLAVPPTAEAVAHLRERLALHFDPAREEPDRYMKQEIDEIRVLAHWMYVHRDSTAQIGWQPGRDIDDLLAEVLRVVDTAPAVEADLDEGEEEE